MRQISKPNMFREFEPKLSTRLSSSEDKVNELVSELEKTGASVQVSRIDLKNLMMRLLKASSKEEAFTALQESVNENYEVLKQEHMNFPVEELYNIFAESVCAISRELAQKNLEPEEACHRVFDWFKNYQPPTQKKGQWN